ncbi:MAG TPA: hypothetical protein PK079_16150 [Leptospiraceae bacterium]|nr:hypothetical protein [Leptospiraceae bacterium]HMW06518.1 hypothetical protein [Leptospiraceae bacterium]HMX33487.1 hypothetical protein [Leptospiraceae bacterium]HMY32844.1 hypothetical protein [Leptospiraceae bacterium]HMZ65339.1 hypothetical protein [Leptospiraceae bacterium]
MNLSIAPTILGILLFGVGMFFFLRYFFKLNSVVYKPVGVVLIILVGIQMMFSELRFGGDPESNTIVGKGPAIAPTAPADTYNVFFGVGENDFTSIPVGSGNTFIETNTFMAKSNIYIRGDVPVRVLIYPTLGVVTLPNGLRFIPFFKNVYKTRAYNDNEKAITIKVNITLGAVNIMER